MLENNRGVVTTITSPSSHLELREQLDQDVSRFLSHGGQIIVVEAGVSAFDDLTKVLSLSPDFRKVSKTKIYKLLVEEDLDEL